MFKVLLFLRLLIECVPTFLPCFLINDEKVFLIIGQVMKIEVPYLNY